MPSEHVNKFVRIFGTFYFKSISKHLDDIYILPTGSHTLEVPAHSGSLLIFLPHTVGTLRGTLKWLSWLRFTSESQKLGNQSLKTGSAWNTLWKLFSFLYTSGWKGNFTAKLERHVDCFNRKPWCLNARISHGSRLQLMDSGTMAISVRSELQTGLWHVCRFRWAGSAYATLAWRGEKFWWGLWGLLPPQEKRGRLVVPYEMPFSPCFVIPVAKELEIRFQLQEMLSGNESLFSCNYRKCFWCLTETGCLQIC